jgi:alpha-tubulin suppressor-like RCC1 family protein
LALLPCSLSLLVACSPSDLQQLASSTDDHAPALSWWYIHHSSHVGYVINPSILYNHDADGTGSESNPFGFRVFWRTQVASNTSVAAPVMTASGPSGPMTVSCTHNLTSGCPKPSDDQYCSCEVLGAQPNTSYTYAINLDGETWTGTLTTRPAKGSAAPFSFAFYSDLHNYRDNTVETMKAMAAQGTAFGLLGGDIGSTSSWSDGDDNLMEADGGLAGDAATGYRSVWPAFAAEGNHEYHARGLLETYGGWPTTLKMYVAAPRSSSADQAGAKFRFYSFNWGQTHFLVVDGGFMNDLCVECGCVGNGHSGECPEGYSPGVDHPQVGFLFNDLKAAKSDPDIKHIIAVVHETPFKYDGDDSYLIDKHITTADDGPNIPVGLHPLHGLFKKFGVELVLGGHRHAYHRMVMDGIEYVTCGIAADPDGGIGSYASAAAAQATLNGMGFCKFTIDGTKLTGEVFLTRDVNGDKVADPTTSRDTWYNYSFAPTNLMSTGLDGSGNITLDWDKSLDAPSGTYYACYYNATSNDANWGTCLPSYASAVGASSMTVAPQTQGSTGRYYIEAYDPASQTYSARTNVLPFKMPYDAISGLSYLVNGAGTAVTLNWYAYPNNGPGGTVVAYNVYRKLSANPDTAYQYMGSVPSGTTTFTDIAPPAGGTIDYKVNANLQKGYADYAYASHVGPLPLALPTSDQVQCAPDSHLLGTVVLNWINQATSYDHLIVGYSTDGGASWSNLTAAPPGTSTFTHNATQLGTSSSYRIGYVDASGNALYGAPTSVSLPPASSPPYAVSAAAGVGQVVVTASYATAPDAVSLLRRPSTSGASGGFTAIARANADVRGALPPLVDQDGKCGYSYDYAATAWYGGFQTAPSAYVTAASSCPPASACASGSPGDVFSANMQGCPGHVTWDNRGSLCAPGYSACGASDWANNRFGQAPHHDYWTDDNLQYTGAGSGDCGAVASGGNLCSSADHRPMRVCSTSQPDAEGNSCTWIGCGLGASTPAAPNQFFGGCSANQYAGTLCCRSGSHGAARAAVASGLNHTCALLDSGAVKCWGSDAYGQLGLADGNAGGYGGAAGQMGDNLAAVNLGTVGGVPRLATDLSVGNYHSCAVLTGGALKCWGRNTYGSLGLEDTTDRGLAVSSMGDELPIVSLGTGRTTLSVTAGNYHTCALLDNGQVKCWGYNGNGTLGLGDTNNRGDNPSEMGDRLLPVALGTGRTARALAAGYHTCAVLDDGSVKCWGYNGYGQLGLGDTSSRGDSAGEMGDALPAVSLGRGRTALAVAVGVYHSCALLDNGQVKCWGHNGYGQLGLGDTNNRGATAGQMGDALPAVALGTGRTAVAIVASAYGTCALLDNHTVKCWGYNGYGQLGQGDTASRGGAAGQMGDALPAIDMQLLDVGSLGGGYYTTCAVDQNRYLKCWGYNGAGQLGLGDTNNRGDGAGEMGAALRGVMLGLGLQLAR